MNERGNEKGNEMLKSTGKRFMEETKYQYLGESDQQKELPQPPLEKAYVGEYEPIALPDVKTLQIPALDLTKAIAERCSQRKYLDKPLTLEELTYLLWATAGVKEIFENRATLRTVPSAGARHSFELYLLVNNVSGLQPGLYRYLALSHQLAAQELRESLKKEITAGCLEQKFVASSAVTFIWVAVAYRMTWRYVERGYRYMYLDAGHACENLYLASLAINSGCCAIAAYDDDEMNRLLNLDGENEFVIYVAPVGKIKE